MDNGNNFTIVFFSITGLRKSFGTHVRATDLKHWIGEKQPVPDVIQEFCAWTADSVELQDFLGGLSLAGPTLPRDQDEVVVELRLHGAEDVVCQRVTGSTIAGHIHLRFIPENFLYLYKGVN